jgi:uncharacterized protein
VSVRRQDVAPRGGRAAPLALAFLLSARAAVSASDPIPPAPTRWVTDKVGFLSAATRDALDRRLEAYERQTGHQVIVWIDHTTGGLSIEDFATRALRKWGVGRKGVEDGLILFLFSDDRRMRIEVGYGFEERVPDVIASRIINDTITPRLKAGEPDAALTEGITAILAAIEGGTVAGPPGVVAGPSASAPTAQRGPPHGRPATLGQMILFGIIGFVFLVILVTNPRLALWILFNMLMSGGRGGGGSGGSSFSGGGGRSGGGGASGGW